ncbi:hypothetical protein CV093_11060 [Oceanobacillus sp. 143]|uniref:Cell wall elongation regulator TseB-like domain-containing protein n=1 Tax=Oceanobacillus zhaokaii TaxID=2052660 RepID=A0A345PH48_9BACI|nr:DUF5590 domain-containing protein [Oceanobacillus zhaokaii]AXI09328.1 hypothetical protein CUC15_10515 [Oceanobacillus zhaokaii]QGS68805.1 hypothetical protein CV093_11060 [Oceanobacillus sp. 143]
MNNGYSQSPKRNWLIKGLITILVIAVACLIYALFLYNNLYESKVEGFAETKKQILAQTAITEVDKIERYNGDSPYHVVYGKNKENEEKIIFYPLNGKEKNLTTVDQADIILEQQILNAWKNQCNHCELVHISPALMDQEPLWEIAYYEDNKSRYVLDYLSMDDASRKEQLHFSKLIK